MINFARFNPFRSTSSSSDAVVSSEAEDQQWLEVELCMDVVDYRKAASRGIPKHFGDRLRSMRVVSTEEDPDRGPIWTFEIVALTNEVELEELANRLRLDLVDIRPK